MHAKFSAFVLDIPPPPHIIVLAYSATGTIAVASYIAIFVRWNCKNLILYMAGLNVYHGRVYSNSVLVHKVEGIAVLNLNSQTRGQTVYHFFDCNSTSTIPTKLVWERENGNQRFPTETSSGTVLRLDMAPTTGQDLRPVMSSDLGVYVCRDSTTDERLAVKVLGGTCATK